METHQCSRCHEAKPLAEFAKGQNYCRPCQAAWSREHRAANRQAALAVEAKRRALARARLERVPAIPPPTKVCGMCRVEKVASEFSPNRSANDGLQGRCKPCASKGAMEWNKAHPEQFRRNQRNSAIRRQFGLESEQYDRLLAKQGHACAICKTPPGRLCLAVDHNHETGRVRGLLCTRCNMALGLLGEDPALLRAMTAYLRRH